MLKYSARTKQKNEKKNTGAQAIKFRVVNSLANSLNLNF